MSTVRLWYRRLRWAGRRALGRDVRFPVEHTVPLVRHGGEAGDWWLCPEGLGPDSVVYSLGIGTDITFDLSLIATYGLTVEAFDPTPGAIDYVRRQQVPPGFHCHALGVAAHDGHATFFPPENPQHISHTLLNRTSTAPRAIDVEVRRLSTLLRDLGHDRIDVLKMDIEGAEYDVLDDVLNQELEIRQILVEFHHRFPEVGLERTTRTVNALGAAGYRIIFASESGEEYSFLRNR